MIDSKFLTVIQDSENRLSDPGKCNSCKYLQGHIEYGTWHGDCSNANLEKLPTEDEKGEEILWGDTQKCLLWEPHKFEYCDKHGFYFDRCDGCDCEIDYYDQVENKV